MLDDSAGDMLPGDIQLPRNGCDQRCHEMVVDPECRCNSQQQHAKDTVYYSRWGAKTTQEKHPCTAYTWDTNTAEG